jgi:DNA repair protein RadC
MRVRDVVQCERPRERLLERGPGVLSDAELLAVLLRTGRPGHGDLDEAHRLLFDAGGLVELARMEAAEMIVRPGFGGAKVASLAAAFELGRRLARAELRSRSRLDDPATAGAFLVPHLKHLRHEVFGFLSLDGRHRLIKINELVVGTRSQAPVDPGDLFRRAVLDGAAGILAYHNHPSGSLVPSRDDLQLTRRLVGSGSLIGVPLLDHLLVAGSAWISLRTTDPELFAVT